MINEVVSTKDEKCPYGCVNGIVFHPRRHVNIPCPHCSKVRKDVVYNNDNFSSEETIESRLGLQERVVGKSEYSFESIFRVSLDKFEQSSLTHVKDELDRLISDLSLGDLPKYSMLFNLGDKIYEENFVNPLLIRAYLAGISVTPLLSVYDIASLRRAVESLDYGNVEESNLYKDYLYSDLSLVTIDEGITKSGLDLIKGFVFARGRLRKPTVILTHSSMSEILYVWGMSEEGYDYSVPRLIQVKYKKKRDESSESLLSDTDSVSTTKVFSKGDFKSMTSNNQFL